MIGIQQKKSVATTIIILLAIVLSLLLLYPVRAALCVFLAAKNIHE